MQQSQPPTSRFLQNRMVSTVDDHAVAQNETCALLLGVNPIMPFGLMTFHAQLRSLCSLNKASS
jgi:hypothetical protein